MDNDRLLFLKWSHKYSCETVSSASNMFSFKTGFYFLIYNDELQFLKWAHKCSRGIASTVNKLFSFKRFRFV
jgi:hypothetical protein